MHNGTTITDLENLVEQVSANAEKGQPAPCEHDDASAVPPSPILCDCEEPATNEYDGEPCCAECYDHYRRQNTDERDADYRRGCL